MKTKVFIFNLLVVLLVSFIPTFAQEMPPCTKMETHAQFPGGIDSLNKYLKENLVYPKNALENTIEGKVTARFRVCKNGRISNILILEGLGFGCDEEVKRVLEAMPAWILAQKAAQATDRYVTVHVQFRLPAI